MGHVGVLCDPYKNSEMALVGKERSEPDCMWFYLGRECEIKKWKSG